MKPLDGIRVLEFSTMITASFAAMMMADQGAEVIKVEPTELGDPMRYLGSTKGGISALFANCNRGKRSLAVDLKADECRTVIEQLAAETDVVLTNYRPGVMAGLGLGSDHLRTINPRLVYAGVTGFGLEGPLATAPAYDPIIQAQTGFPAVQGQGKDAPEFMQSLMCDKVTAYTICQAVTAALFVRERTGEGQHIDLSMTDASPPSGSEYFASVISSHRSLPSRVRSPTPQNTLKPPFSTAVIRISSWISTVLPTPAPPNRPILPPFANGHSRSTTLMPVSKISETASCSSNLGAGR